MSSVDYWYQQLVVSDFLHTPLPGSWAFLHDTHLLWSEKKSRGLAEVGSFGLKSCLNHCFDRRLGYRTTYSCVHAAKRYLSEHYLIGRTSECNTFGIWVEPAMTPMCNVHCKHERNTGGFLNTWWHACLRPAKRPRNCTGRNGSTTR